MNSQHQSTARAGSVYEAVDDNSITDMQTITGENDSTFSIVDSAEMKLFPLMSPAATSDAAMLYLEKGEVTLMYGMKTCILSKGMLLYKVPDVAVQLLSFSEDCHFKVFSFAPQFPMDANIPVKHLDTITKIASNNPVFILDTLTAATVTVLFWILHKKVNWEEKAQSPDETIEHVFTLLMLELISSYKRNTEDNGY